MPSLPTEPFNRRIEVLLAVVDTPGETDLATQLLEAQGWAVRPWEGSDPDTIGAGRHGLLVEVRLYGARLGAVRAAVSEIERLAQRHQAGMWVVEAVLVEHELDCDHRTRYHVREQDDATATLPFSLRALRRSLTSLRIVIRPGRPNLDLVSERLEQGAFTGRPFDPRGHQLIAPTGMEGRDVDAPPRDTGTSAWRIALPLVAGLLLALTSGFALVAFEGFFLLLPIVVAGLLVWPVGRTVIGTGERRPLRLQLAWGALAVGMMTAFGLVLALTVPGTAEAAVVVTFAVTGLATLVFVLHGLAYALVHSWFSRNANWAVPALVPALALTLPWFGGLLHTMYLGAFGIPGDGAPVSLYWRYVASLLPLGVALVMTVFWIAVAGWLRHYHQWIHSRGTSVVTVSLVCALIFGMFVLAGIGGAEMASGRASTAARTGETPDSYFGLVGKLVCAKPLDDEVAVFNGPLNSKKPLLTFGPAGDRVWLWDPRRTDSLSLRLEDVVVTETRSGRCG
ncbi:hypothetical protein G5C60_38895 [Streptomyces sp. HC44]|uniref:Uncharacterized protein n=1 Tax=Streptomyces scabichelini TaxID=2711217 RepID=A0A6G4VGY1_9ACTN|nr:hypothetical protein [Streptomyces scabichelini]NGO13408.1 hypothetical protein [Streptomyces scabichelini]